MGAHCAVSGGSNLPRAVDRIDPESSSLNLEGSLIPVVRFAYSTNAYTQFPLLEAINEIRRLGFEGVEILADAPHAFPGGVNVAALACALKTSRLVISNLNGNTSLGLDTEKRDPTGFWPSFLDPDPGVRRMRMDYVKSVVDLARALGAESVCTASGRLPRGVSKSRASGFLIDALEPILAHAEKRPPVRLGVEYEPGFLIGDLRSLLGLLQKIRHPLLGANLDLGHAVCVGDDPCEAIEALQGRIWNMHVEDIRGRIHEHLVPGKGEIRFDRIRDAVEKGGYKGFLTLELYPYKANPSEAGKRGLEFLKPIFA